MPHYLYIIIIPLLPLASFVLLGMFGRKCLGKSSGIVATVSLLISSLLALYAAYNYFFIEGKSNGVYRQIVAMKHTWLQFSPNISIDMGIMLDPISVMMIVIVTFVSLMVMRLYPIRF